MPSGKVTDASFWQIGFRRTIESSSPGKAFPLVASLLHFASKL